MSNLGGGQHEAALFADGQLLKTSTFTVTELSTGKFNRGVEAMAVVNNFPAPGKEATLEWVESTQNFMIKQEKTAQDRYEVSGV